MGTNYIRADQKGSRGTIVACLSEDDYLTGQDDIDGAMSMKDICSILQVISMFPFRYSVWETDLWSGRGLGGLVLGTPSIHKKCRSFCSMLVQILYY